MSKSLGNFFTLREIADAFSYEVLRFFILSAHYRSPVNFSKELLRSAQNGLDRLKNSAGLVKYAADNNGSVQAGGEDEILREASVFVSRFDESMDDDLNTANAIAVLFELAKYANKQVSNPISGAAAALLLDMLLKPAGVLGLDLLKNTAADTEKNKEIEGLIERRQNARKARDFQTADAIRKTLIGMGVIIEDRIDGVRWSFVSNNADTPYPVYGGGTNDNA